MGAEAVHGLRPAFRHAFEHGGRLGALAAGDGVHGERGLAVQAANTRARGASMTRVMSTVQRFTFRPVPC
jgi:hypothetical protein